MNKLHILIEGYAKPSDDGESFFASCSTILLQNQGKNILVDPGANRELLLESLSNLKLGVKDIDILFLTHWHPDHFLNIQLFPNLDVMDGTTIWKNTGEEVFPNGDATIERIVGTDIEVIATPGHREEHVSLLFTDDDLGKICIAQDVFWWEDGKQPDTPSKGELLMVNDPYLADGDELMKSREKVLALDCDWIIPGHGRMFRNPMRG